MIIEYPHKKGTHCETASIKNLLDFYGLSISEEMIFGIGSGLNFIHFPFPRTATWENLRQKPVNEATDMKYLSDIILSIAKMEEIFFKELRKWVKERH